MAITQSDMQTAAAFVSYVNEFGLDREDATAVTELRNDEQDWVDDLGPEYLGTLGDGHVVAWAAEHPDGRDLIVINPAGTKEHTLFIPSWIEA